ncbi:putative protein phosphatase 2A regulatory subunit [Monocercomonoides exilis]|uniref:putative protein phosphatase 2A regulatory subunit n=1 Tax=Monocercomonoides exilis TaxID=2049356 RepID=UPI00355AB50A|nr:putative protein phosphatase 2A regulatory subunit [Monocercomonoides exilis]|eukprot:MONOS_3601.1-p1 / transcript=MONOS_3601.1 / gene=MONOS_3601 / organism=Monocercomonoides_exilis_PA203 / gene_product=protein phosphatase 2A regulatory subunit / transcript_product=protein phosphatase 2A regulatory subunit / location=Mono_scaffold00086:39308-42185(+) / protein_length=740 / sequence_SO=supercontig / SO=protein_coding / is_pseudo=false
MQEETFVLTAIFIDGLKSDDRSQKLKSIHHLSLIAKTLGPERTREELLPFLPECFNDDTDILIAYADELGKLAPHVGGFEHVHHIFPLLEQLSSFEDASVRDRALASLVDLIPLVPKDNFKEHVVGLVKRMGDGDWYTKKCSAACLCPFVYKLSEPNEKDEILKLFFELANDEVHMIRHGVTQVLQYFIPIFQPKQLTEQIFPLIEQMCSDEQDSVRHVAVSALLSFVETASKLSLLLDDELVQRIVNNIINFFNDISWRIRNKMVNAFLPMAKNLPIYVVREELLNEYLNMLLDSEYDVCLSVSLTLPDVCSLVGRQTLVHPVFDSLKPLLTDPNFSMKEFAESAIIVGARVKDEFSTIIQPILFTLLKPITNLDVKSTTIATILRIKKCLQIPSLLSECVSALSSLRETIFWRCRCDVLHSFPVAAKILSSLPPQTNTSSASSSRRVRFSAAPITSSAASTSPLSSFTSTLFPFLVDCLKDDAVSVRDAAIDALVGITSIGWADLAKMNYVEVEEEKDDRANSDEDDEDEFLKETQTEEKTDNSAANEKKTPKELFIQKRDSLGMKWAEKEALTVIKQLSEEERYTLRQTSLRAVREMSDVMILGKVKVKDERMPLNYEKEKSLEEAKRKEIEKERKQEGFERAGGFSSDATSLEDDDEVKEERERLLRMLFAPIALSLADDSVPNVRLNCAATLAHLIQITRDESMKDTLLASLLKLSKDKDQDVRNASTNWMDSLR